MAYIEDLGYRWGIERASIGGIAEVHASPNFSPSRSLQSFIGAFRYYMGVYIDFISLSADQPTALCLGDLDLEYFCTYLSRAA